MGGPILSLPFVVPRMPALANIAHCDKCRRPHIVNFRVEPEEAFKMIVLNRWREICRPALIRKRSALRCSTASWSLKL
jgi:hypothetical protein